MDKLKQNLSIYEGLLEGEAAQLSGDRQGLEEQIVGEITQYINNNMN